MGFPLLIDWFVLTMSDSIRYTLHQWFSTWVPRRLFGGSAEAWDAKPRGSAIRIRELGGLLSGTLDMDSIEARSSVANSERKRGAERGVPLV